jgi:anti-sigma factor RsiW
MPVSSCRWFVARLPLLVGDDLLGPERRVVQRHLVTCDACRARLERLRVSQTALHLVAARPLDAVPGGAQPGGSLWPELARQIREGRAPRPAGRPRWLAPVAGLAAALLVMALLGFAAARRLERNRPTVAQSGAPAGARGKSIRTVSIVRPAPPARRRPDLAGYDGRTGIPQERAAADLPRGSGPIGLAH